MYSPHSPALSYGDHYHTNNTSHLNAGFHLSSNSSPSNYSTTARSNHSLNHHHQQQLHTNVLVAAAAAAANPMPSQKSTLGASLQCLRFKYFATFFVCTTCLGLLAASLATHKWLISKPIRVLRLNNGQVTNFTALMLTATLGDDDNERVFLINNNNKKKVSSQKLQSSESTNSQQLLLPTNQQTNSKFQGEIYFGLFNGVKVLNYGFGERLSQLSGE